MIKYDNIISNIFGDSNVTNDSQFIVLDIDDIVLKKTIIDVLSQYKNTIIYGYNFDNIIKIFEDKNFNTYKGMTTIGNTSFNDNTLDIKNNDYVNLTSILLSYYIKIN